MAQFSAITIDVDSIDFYLQIHGLPHVPNAPDPIYDVALPRFFDLLDAARLPATLFLIAKDAAQNRRAFASLAALGCEVASHSYAHDYRLTQQSPAAIREDLETADAILRELAPGGRIVGFRAPGYNLCPAVLQTAIDLGYVYDSSLLPAPAYHLVRAAAIGAYRLRGRRSSSIVGDIRAFAGPRDPYRMTPDRPWDPSGGPILELPIAVHPKTRVPLIGTTWPLLPAFLRSKMLTQTLNHCRVFNFEMHAIDLLDASDPGIPSKLAAAQPDLRRSATQKLELFRDLFATLADETEVRTLADIAAAIEGDSVGSTSP